MKVRVFLGIHCLAIASFLFWYFFLDGYLGYELGDLAIVLPMFPTLFFSIFLLANRNTSNHKGAVYVRITLFYLILFGLFKSLG